MDDNNYDGPVKATEMVKFLSNLDEDVEVVHSNGVYGSVTPEKAAEYLEHVIEGEASTSATPWDGYNGRGLLDPQSLEPWENSDSDYTGRLRIQEGEVTEDGFSYRFDFKARDGDSEEVDIWMAGEESGNLDNTNFHGAYINKALSQIK